ncbi:peptidyl-prolyl cis-trans isomerase [Maribacter sp. R77961]|jgi:hypothetical protein|uniref:peptidyl-prolyl cis-trans isomerase n=1 Tax=Maribacter sp. R77961 TaxID=3093871 RepID=UPI0037CC26F4
MSTLRVLVFGVFAFVLLLTSCDDYFKKKEVRAPLARVGEAYLYKEDIANLITSGMSKVDSASFVSNYINSWASRQLLLSKSKINLSEEKLKEFDALVANYRTDLYTRAYKEALVSQGADSLITQKQLEEFYELEKENFKLKERLVKIRFIELPKTFLNKEEVSKSLKNFNPDDIVYLDSIGVQFKKLHFNDSLWVTSSRVLEEIPAITADNEDKYLKKSQFFELEDSMAVYLGKIEDVKQVNDIAPLSFISPTIKQVLLSRRKIDYLRKLETEIIDEAIRDKEFEIFTKNE